MPGEKKNKVAVYQVKVGGKYDKYRFRHYEELVAVRVQPSSENYDRVYLGPVEPSDTPYEIYHRFILQLPQGYKGRGINTSDVIVIRINGSISAYYIDLGTLVALPSFLKPKKKLPAKERGVEKEIKETEQVKRPLIKQNLINNKEKIKQLDEQKKKEAEARMQQQQEENEKNNEHGKTKNGKDEMDI